MARASFTCAECGESVEIHGRNRRDANSLAEWHERQGHICDVCTARRRAEESATAAEKSAQAGLPALTGTPKQIAWAETLRRELLDRIERVLPHLTTTGTPDELKGDYLAGLTLGTLRELREEEGEEAVTATLAVLRRQASASWWIDQRDKDLERLVGELGKQILEEMGRKA